MGDAVFVARILTGAVFLAAAAAKARSGDGFGRSVRSALSLVGVHVGVAGHRAVTGTVVAYEAVLGGLLLSGWAPRAAAVAGLLLVALFALVSALALLRGRKIECNCFGRSDARLGGETLVRAAMLGAALVLYAAWPHGAWPSGLEAWTSSLALVVGSGLLAVWALRLRTVVTFARDRRLVESRATPSRVERSRKLQRLRTI